MFVWQRSDPVVFWTGLEAVVVTITAAFVFWQVRAFRAEQRDREARGFVLLAENFIGQDFHNSIKMLIGALDLDETKRAKGFDGYAIDLVHRLEIVNAFIERGLVDEELFFLSYPGDMRDAALYIRHLRHHPQKMPWMIENESQYLPAFQLLRRFEGWIARRENRQDYDD